jgi:MFS family permease
MNRTDSIEMGGAANLAVPGNKLPPNRNGRTHSPSSETGAGGTAGLLARPNGQAVRFTSDSTHLSRTKPRGIQLGVWHRRWFYGVSLLLFLTGAVWVLFDWLATREEARADFFQSLEVWALKVHGAAAMAFLVVLGMLILTHIKPGWRMRRNRANGAVVVMIVALLVVSGYGLYYFGDEQWRSAASWIHVVLGLAAPPLLCWHIWSGRKAVNRVSKLVGAQRSDGEATSYARASNCVSHQTTDAKY